MPRNDLSPVDIYLRDIRSMPELTREEELDLFHRIGAGDEEARKHVIKAHLKLVVKIAKKYSRLGVPFMDLVEEGNLGLFRASHKFDLTKGCRFATYASWWIKQFIMRALANQGKTIRLPVYMVERVNRIEKLTNSYKAKHNQNPTVDEIAQQAQLPREKILEIFNIAKKTQSLNVLLNEDKEFIDIIEDKTAIHSEQVVAASMLQEEIIDLLSHLKPREMEIISKRFGLDGSRPQTLKEIGEEYGVSRERVRQIEEVSLRKLKKIMKKKGIFWTDF
ncbi:MAG: RNA polymerase sigma factor RpoD/SigA [Verrucomicrobia bacterium]|nr:RNA polymerase sigma factor RpoD/SigA [Verrucomicrobiota bacterium]